MLWSALSHPLWAALTALLAAAMRLQRRGPWLPGACTVRLAGKTALVTGANTGEEPHRGATGRARLGAAIESTGCSISNEVWSKFKISCPSLRSNVQV